MASTNLPCFYYVMVPDHEIFDLITSGNVAYELCRPTGIYGFWFAKLTAQRLSAALLRCMPILLVAFLMPVPYRMTLPPSLSAFGLFLISLLLGLLVVVGISMLIYISVFYTMSPIGSILMIGVAGEFMAGMILPVPLMPYWLQQIVYLLPFRYTADFPFRVYSGHIPTQEALVGVGVQLVWIGALVGWGRVWLQRAIRRVVIQGG